MILMTSYFANMKNLPEDTIKISISRFTPKWVGEDVIEMKHLAPTIDILNLYKSGCIDQNVYTKMYLERVLSKLDATTLIESLEQEFGEDAKIAFLCYENPRDFCHRHLFARWLDVQCATNIAEW